MKNMLYNRWINIAVHIRKPLVFLIGMLFIILSPFAGVIPGPGGILVFLVGISILASEFDWAENLKSILLVKLPSEVKRRWQPTPAWALVFDISAVILFTGSVLFILNGKYIPATSFGVGAISLFLFNRNRLQYFKRKR